MSTFTWTPGYAAELSETPNILMANFGDGYQQISPDGINPTAQVWNLTFSGKTDVDANAIISFFRAHAGAVTFDWTPPRSPVQIQAICQQWRRQIVAPNASHIMAVFMQVFTPIGYVGTNWDFGVSSWDGGGTIWDAQ